MQLHDIKKLHQKKYRQQFGHYLLEGEHLILELVKAAKQQPGLKDCQVFVSEDYEAFAKQLAFFKSVTVVNAKTMAQLSDTKTPQGIVACVPMATKQAAKPLRRYVYLHEVQDPGNLGTIIRTLAWFGDTGLILSPNSVDPFNPKVVRASMGATFHVPIEQDVALATLASRFTRFAYLDMQGESVRSDKFARYECYLFGNEARGVPTDALAAYQADPFTIEGAGQIDSLNLASAVNMCVFQLAK